MFGPSQLRVNSYKNMLNRISLTSKIGLTYKELWAESKVRREFKLRIGRIVERTICRLQTRRLQ